MKKLLPLLIGLSLAGFSQLSQAENLLEVYQQARLSNPDLRQSAADRDAAFEKINESRSPLLPQLGLGVDYTYNNGYYDRRNVNSNVASGALQLTQTIFDMSLWRALTIQEKTAGVQDVTYQAAQQTLILNTATAYFNVLSAIDTLSYTEAQKQSIYRELDQTTQRFQVGLVAITDVHNARANYDQVLADEVAARNNLDNMLETLRQVSGNYYPQLASLNIERFKPERSQPIAGLLKEAEQRNLSLLSARLSQDVARENIRLYEAGHYPTLSLSASSTVTNTDYNGSATNNNTNFPNSKIGQNAIGLNLSVPIYSGGSVTSQVKQAQYSFVSASEKLESAHRSMVSTVRTSFNNISADVSSIDAYQQAVVSAQSSLDASQAGYEVGTRTIVDVLDATTTLYNAKRELSEARYSYLVNQLTLKSALGTLNENDIQQLNASLGLPIATSPEQVAPENPSQTAKADSAGQRQAAAAPRAAQSGSAEQAVQPRATTTSATAPASSATGRNPFRQ